MGELWRGLVETLKVALATFVAFMAGQLKAENDQLNRDLERRLRESKTDAKNRDDVAGLTDGQLDDELRNPPPRR